jgi:type IV fimbrial biogenesis protein FimT
MQMKLSKPSSKYAAIRRFSFPHAACYGFTLVELIVTIAIFAVIVGFAIPGMQNLITNNRITNLANEFNSALTYTRSEALNRNMCVSMCITTDPTAPNPSCSSILDEWNSGWIVFSNPTCTNATDTPLPGNFELLQVYAGNSNGPRLITAAGPITKRRFNFNSRGVLNTINAGGTLTIDTGAPNYTSKKTVCVDIAGRARIGEYYNLACN